MTTKRMSQQLDSLPRTLFAPQNNTDETVYPIVLAPRTQTPTGSVLQVQIGPADVISNLPIVVDYDHHQVHEGETFISQYADAALDTNTIKFGIVVPTKTPADATTCPHMIIKCDCYNGNARVDLYESTNITGGTLMNIYNRERNSANTSATICYHSITAATGTLINSFYVGGGFRASGSSRADEEFVLKSNTQYRVDVVGLAAGTDAIVGFNWYEDLGV